MWHIILGWQQWKTWHIILGWHLHIRSCVMTPLSVHVSRCRFGRFLLVRVVVREWTYNLICFVRGKLTLTKIDINFGQFTNSNVVCYFRWAETWKISKINVQRGTSGTGMTCGWEKTFEFFMAEGSIQISGAVRGLGNTMWGNPPPLYYIYISRGFVWFLKSSIGECHCTLFVTFRQLDIFLRWSGWLFDGEINGGFVRDGLGRIVLAMCVLIRDELELCCAVRFIVHCPRALFLFQRSSLSVVLMPFFSFDLNIGVMTIDLVGTCPRQDGELFQQPHHANCYGNIIMLMLWTLNSWIPPLY